MLLVPYCIECVARLQAVFVEFEHTAAQLSLEMCGMFGDWNEGRCAMPVDDGEANQSWQNHCQRCLH